MQFFLLIISICCYSCSDISEEKRNKEDKQNTISDSIIEQLEGKEHCSENIDTSNFMKAYKAISNSVAKPDTLMMLDEDIYLAVVRSVNADDSGLYIIDFKNLIPEKLSGGSPTIIRTQEEKNGYKWVLVSLINQSEVKKKLVYSALIFNSKESDNKRFIYSQLASFNQYYETCTCNEKYEIAPNSLKEIEKLNRFDIKDEDGDGFLDIIFSTISLDCVTSERKIQKRITYSQKWLCRKNRNNRNNISRYNLCISID
ncbi:MAG: hypothetical protein IPO21_10075 [Bacteroidales bacterium]|nr:hypothetical protein [Bacteroidales bacterium]